MGSFYFRRIGAGWYHGAGASLLLEAFLRGSFLFGTSVQISSMCCVGLLIDLLIVRAMREEEDQVQFEGGVSLKIDRKRSIEGGAYIERIG